MQHPPRWIITVSNHTNAYVCLKHTVGIVIDDKPSELGLIIRYLKTSRNNLFHGGKHDDGGWEDTLRNKKIVELSIFILDELAVTSNINNDYTGEY